MSGIDLALAPGERVSVTYDDGFTTRRWHAIHAGIHMVEVLGVAPPLRVWGSPSPLSVPWFKATTAHRGGFELQDLPKEGSTWSIGPAGLCFKVGAPGWSVTELTEEGAKYLDALEPPEEKCHRLIGELRATNPALADQLERAVNALADQIPYTDEY